MKINNNITSLNTHRMLGTNKTLSQSIERLSSGLCIGNEGDEAGLAISEKMRTDIRGLDRTVKGLDSGIKQLEAAESRLSGLHEMLNRVLEISMIAAGNDQDTSGLSDELERLKAEIDYLSSSAQLDGKTLLNGSSAAKEQGGSPLLIEIGADTSDAVEIPIGDMSASALGLDKISLSGSDEKAAETIEVAKQAIETVVQTRALLGVAQNQLEAALGDSKAAVSPSRSEEPISGVDFVDEMTLFTKTDVVTQASVQTLAQANQLPENVLKLLE